MSIEELLKDESGMPVYAVRVCRHAHQILLENGSYFHFLVYAELTSLRDRYSGMVGMTYPLLTKDFKLRFGRQFKRDHSQGRCSVPVPNPTQIEWAILQLKKLKLVDISAEAVRELKGRIRLYMPHEIAYDDAVRKKYGLSKKFTELDVEG